MRLWSIHPRYLDRIGLIALWREGLLAQKVLAGQTRGYRNHPQLTRFKNYEDPILSIGTYLYRVYLEGKMRNYQFNPNKILKYDSSLRQIIPIRSGQIIYEFKLLMHKLGRRDRDKLREIMKLEKIDLNPIFYEVDGGIEEWEKVKHF